jgi:UDP-N-acetylglucosamine 2-epimerase (non-hydrolysing)
MLVLDTPYVETPFCDRTSEQGESARPETSPPKKVLTLFGTRPEVIKLAPVLRQLEAANDFLQTVNVASSQHTDLLHPFIRLFGIRTQYDLRIMRAAQTPHQVCSRVLAALRPILTREKPHLILVQGDTATALAGAIAGFRCRIPVGHVEAGLRSGNVFSPYPEELHRRLITRLATYHFAPTCGNRDRLLAEGVRRERIFLTGNPVVDALKAILERYERVFTVQEWLNARPGVRRIVLTTHRRESFGKTLAENLKSLRCFVESHPDVVLTFPVHPNPAVREVSRAILSGHPRIELIEPLDYIDFIGLLFSAWLIISDSGGIQEEAPTLGKPLLILRENTERPEVIDSGIGRLVGGRPQDLSNILEEVYRDEKWIHGACRIPNPFGHGDASARIVQALRNVLLQTDPLISITSNEYRSCYDTKSASVDGWARGLFPGWRLPPGHPAWEMVPFRNAT